MTMLILYSILVLFTIISIVPVYAESQTLPTEKGTLDVKLTHDAIEPNTQTKINIDFLNPQTQKVQEHIDYTISVSKDGERVFGPIPLTHTSLGSVKIPIEFNLGEGVYTMDFEIEGILFQPIPTETVSFDIVVGKAYAQPTIVDDGVSPVEENGGCLIATATYGTELAPQVQFLREIRDNTVMSTSVGTSFMTGFNQLYYSFSPTIADMERENPLFKQTVRAFITPMISTLSIMTLAEDGNDFEVLGLGISIITINLGMYVAAPALVGITLSKRLRN